MVKRSSVAGLLASRRKRRMERREQRMLRSQATRKADAHRLEPWVRAPGRGDGSGMSGPDF